jgi:hypothetical protein
VSVDVSIAGEGCRLTLRLLGWEHPELVTGSDANWIRGEVELVATSTGRFTARQPVSVVTEDLERFRSEVRALLAGLDGEASFENLEAQFGLKVALKAGTGELEVFVTEHAGAQLRVVHVATDQSYLAQTLRELETAVAQFGVRGRPCD